MPKIPYIHKRFSTSSLLIIEKVNEICEEYSSQGFVLTLRQLYYQFVARDLIPNTQASYKKLGSIVNDGRLAGLIDWNHLIDRTRNLQTNSHWSNPAEIIYSAAHSYRLDLWEDQPYRVEVWIEKDALVGVIERICRRLDVAFFSCRGYTSQSEMWSAAQRLRGYANAGQEPIIIHLGDHDPSGMDMSRDIYDRLDLLGRGPYKVERIALNMDQVEEYGPPPNPAKLTDTRARDYIAQFGDESWELDALDPQTLERLIEETVLSYRNEDLYQAMFAKQEEERRLLKTVSDKWVDLTKGL